MKSFRRILKYIGKFPSWIGVNIISNILTALFTVVSIPLLKPFLDILFQDAATYDPNLSWVWDMEAALQYMKNELSYIILQEGRNQALVYIIIVIVVSFFLKNLFRYLSMFSIAPVRNGVIRDIRSDIFNKVLGLPIGYYNERKKGDLLSRMTGDVVEVENSILNMIEVIFKEPLIIVFTITYMVSINPVLTLFVFGLILFTGLIIGGVGKTLKKNSEKVQQYLGNLVSIVEETLAGMRIVKAFNAENYNKEKFEEQNESYRNLLIRLLRRRDLASPLTEFMGISVVAVLLWFGSRYVFSGDMEPGTFITFLFAFYMVIEPSKKLNRAISNIQKGIGAMKRIEELLDTKSDLQEAENPVELTAFSKGIEYKNVDFRYSNSLPLVLKNINLKINKGMVVALVGSSGAGKSTMADILPRFYDVEKGQILIDGVDIKNYSLNSLRKSMGIVSQDPILFHDTIYNNIVFGSENITEQQVFEAAKIANAHDFITATQKGYQTLIGDRGVKLSGGQRQRLTIARAVLKNPSILILDEATSALDSESEKLVQSALENLMQSRTSLVIAHRLSTIQHADIIVVMKDGKIIEKGSHAELLETGGDYSKLVEMQHF